MVDHGRDRTPRTPGGQSESGTQTPAGAGDRVAKALARAGVASRRDAERLIAEGRVALNGRILSEPGVKLAPGDILTLDGAPIAEREPTRVWRYHKPAGLVTTHKDPRGRPTVFEALGRAGLPRVISVGRLDLNSEGLLLVTNDGALARALELPATGWVRTYRARAFGRTSQAALDRLKDGITAEGVRYGPIQARLDKAKGADEDAGGPANVWITVSLSEGKNREVRRVLEALGLKVNRLLRLAYGPFALGTLGVGEVEEVGPRVIREQLAAFIAPESLPRGARASVGVIRTVEGAPPRRPSQPGPAPARAGRRRRPRAPRRPSWCARPAGRGRNRSPSAAASPAPSPSRRTRGGRATAL